MSEFEPIETAPGRIQIYGHRGTRGLMPENSIPAYQVALALGVDFVDMDVVLTKDGELAVYHDLFLNSSYTKGPDGQYVGANQLLVRELTMEQLGQYDIGSMDPTTAYGKLFPDQRQAPGTRIPSLREVIRYTRAVAGDEVGFQIELKNDPRQPDWGGTPEQLAEAVARVVAEEGVSARTEVQAFDGRCLFALQSLAPDLATQYLTAKGCIEMMNLPDLEQAGLWTGGHLVKDYGGSLPKMIKALGGRVWEAQDLEISRELVDEAHQLGLKVVAWNWVEDPRGPIPSDGRAGTVPTLIDMGVDGIIHDRPDVVRGLLLSRGRPLPAPFPKGLSASTWR